MRGSTDEPISPAIERAAARRIVLAHSARGHCGPTCGPVACRQIAWAREYLARQGDADRAAAVAAGEGDPMIQHIADASTIEGEWVKSTRSSSNGACVELADLGDTVAVRNSREPAGPALLLTIEEVRAFVEGAKTGEFDRFYLRR